MLCAEEQTSCRFRGLITPAAPTDFSGAHTRRKLQCVKNRVFTKSTYFSPESFQKNVGGIVG